MHCSKCSRCIPHPVRPSCRRCSSSMVTASLVSINMVSCRVVWYGFSWYGAKFGHHWPPDVVIHNLMLPSFQELQSEVSSLLEFKNALLNEFPHLHQKISHLGVPHPPPQDERRRSTLGLVSLTTSSLPSPFTHPFPPPPHSSPP